MIFITLGTQKFPFDRLLQEIDRLIENGVIKDKVFAQIGFSLYEPKNYEFIYFLTQSEFEEKIKSCDIFITHGGVGSIIGGLKTKKKMIVCPRLAKYGEHIDDHQLEIANKYYELGYCLTASDEYTLEDCLSSISSFNSTFVENHSKEQISDYIIKYIDKTLINYGKEK